jgi:iron complex outermembrane receptor protein
MITDLPDLERVEVLRGPQSTLFGKNASAGVISISTRKPQFNFGGNVEATYGNFNAMVLKGLVTGPLSESVAASISGSYNKRDGVIDDLGTGHETNERNRWSMRGQLLFQPDGPLSVRLIADYGKIDENCCAAVNLRPASATLAIRALGGKVNDFATPFADVVYNNFDSTNKITNWGGSGQIDYDLGPLKLTSITAYRGVKALTNQDSDFSSADLLGENSQNLNIRTLTQELRLSGELTDKVSFLLGGYYFDEKIKQANAIRFGSQFRPYGNILASSLGQTLPGLETLFGSLQGNPAKYTGQFFAAGQGLFEDHRLKNNAFSIFSQIDFEIADGLTLTGWLNYTHDKKRYRTDSNSTDIFSTIDVPAMVTAATNAGVSAQVFRAVTGGGTGQATA